MSFVEPRFFFFLAGVLAVYWSLSSPRVRKDWLLFCSICFYGAWNWKFVPLIFLPVLVDFYAARAMDRTRNERRRHSLIVLSLVTNLGALAYFKYCNFFITSASAFFAFAGLPFRPGTLEIVLPIGISFYTFHTLSYTIDVYRRELQPVKSLRDFALAVCFFPQLVAGPIVRASFFLPQLKTGKLWRSVDLRRCLALFLSGYVKKACIADNLAPVVDRYFKSPGAFGAASAWLAVMSYAIQIYCDFSGYTDMAMGVAGLLGFELPENFAFPYFSSSVTEFWRRWHISLSTWLRDYLYIPLGGNRGSLIFNYRNLMITMLLGGLWHGASWNFVIWGALHGAALVFHREWVRSGASKRAAGPWMKLAAPLLTLYWVLVTWIFFRADDLDSALRVLRTFVRLESAGTQALDPRLGWVLAGLALIHWLGFRGRPGRRFEKLPRPVFYLAYGSAWALALAFTQVKYVPFIYFQF